MKYVKLRCYDVPAEKGPYIENWHLVIDNVEDLMKHAELETYLYSHAFLGLERTSTGLFDGGHGTDIRSGAVATVLNTRISATPEGQKIHPIVELASMCDQKTRGMLNYITKYGAIQVNQSGGYCGYDTFVNTWNAEVVQTIEKDTLGFPIEEDALCAKTLILENQKNVFSVFKTKVEAITHSIASTICLLKEKDFTWVLKSIQQADNIAFESQLQDSDQIDQFMTLFSKLPRKRLILGIYEKDRPKLTTHALWNTNNARHEIVFID